MRDRWVDLPSAAFLHAGRLALAAGLAFAITVPVTGQPAPLFAPWTALYAVYPTVARSGWAALQRFAALSLGGGMAMALVEFSGRSSLVIGLVVFVAALVGRWRRLGEHGLDVAGVALLVLIVSGSRPFAYVADLAVETAVGLACALCVNVLLPPLHLGLAADALDRLRQRVATLLEDVAEYARCEGGRLDWRDWGRRLDSAVAEARVAVTRSGESTRWNLRRVGKGGDTSGSERALDALEHAAVESRSIARGLVWHGDDDHRLFAVGSEGTRLAGVLDLAAEAVRLFGTSDPGDRQRLAARVAQARGQLGDLSAEVRGDERDGGVRWSRENAVIVSAGRLLREMDRADHPAVRM